MPKFNAQTTPTKAAPRKINIRKRTTCADCRLCMGTSVNTRKVITIKVHGAGRSNFA